MWLDRTVPAQYRQDNVLSLSGDVGRCLQDRSISIHQRSDAIHSRHQVLPETAPWRRYSVPARHMLQYMFAAYVYVPLQCTAALFERNSGSLDLFVRPLLLLQPNQRLPQCG